MLLSEAHIFLRMQNTPIRLPNPVVSGINTLSIRDENHVHDTRLDDTIDCTELATLEWLF